MSFTLFYAPGSIATIPHVLLEEMGVPYQLRRLDPPGDPSIVQDSQTGNPTGRVPALADDNMAIFETGAILLHLASKPEAKDFAPAYGTAEYAKFLQWLFYLITTTQPTVLEYVHPEWWTHNRDEQSKLRKRAASRLSIQCNLLEAHVSDGSFLFQGYSVLDMYLTELARWSADLSSPIWSWKKLGRIVEATRQRPAFKRMLQQQSLIWPGETDPKATQRVRFMDWWS